MVQLKLPCKRTNLQLTGTLNGGQSFRWKKRLKDETTEQWIGVVGSRVWLLEQNEDEIVYEVHESDVSDESEDLGVNPMQRHEQALTDYFRLNLDLTSYYKEWSLRDPHFKRASEQFYGIRILQQDPTENIFTFICSQNNHISRISTMVEKLAALYGAKICDLDRTSYHSFPKAEALSQAGVEKTLRDCGFGYRARYISQAAQQIVKKGGDEWLESLKCMDYPAAKKELTSLTGIGPKVADCICLMSLGHLQAIPVDTHIYQIAMKFYLPDLPKRKSVSEKTYKEIGDHFRKLYGPLAGWAHTVLFCADLKMFREDDRFHKRQKTSI